jgi:hypothetical protein
MVMSGELQQQLLHQQQAEFACMYVVAVADEVKLNARVCLCWL